ncbi:MAG: hypothetical protein ACR2KG_06085 [Nocardioidaceae bacterium]
MQVLWWLVPPLAATCVAMLWVSWAGRDRDEVRRDDSAEALRRMQQALTRPTPHAGSPVASTPIEKSHGVALRVSRRHHTPPRESAR